MMRKEKKWAYGLGSAEDSVFCEKHADFFGVDEMNKANKWCRNLNATVELLLNDRSHLKLRM